MALAFPIVVRTMRTNSGVRTSRVERALWNTCTLPTPIYSLNASA